MNFSDLAVEIRLRIYSELLVNPGPIDFVADFGPSSPPLFRRQRDGLYPAILRVNKEIHREASPVLYAWNHFRFPEVFSLSAPVSAYITPFLNRIGSHASLIRHIRIPFPTFDYPLPDRAVLHEVHVKNLETIRRACAGLQTIELLVPAEHCNYALRDDAIAPEALNILDMRLQSMPSLKEITVNFEVYDGGDSSDDLTELLHGHSWAVKVTKLPKKVWTSYDDRVEFDNEEDCERYDNEQFGRQMEQGEKDSWSEEYYRRRSDPYWKNDSDYD
ncbi:uncharacterized protein PV07_08897 [Cladophialophora immunda]|uniref:Uncharacterized protein n=1 Tax=Cladophialophora immunda TaxID=569365 RepID=A0A0D1ZDA9_9EURO|nr:uncharacterized protein PV07_08897 [Cladophialophora immunda]KIW25741.1 hypothetical protein PV07_08897 [Cladophialophora immunda]